MPLLKDLCHLLQVAVAPDADRVRGPVPPPDAPAVRRLPHARRPHRAVPARLRLLFALRAFFVCQHFEKLFPQGCHKKNSYY